MCVHVCAHACACLCLPIIQSLTPRFWIIFTGHSSSCFSFHFLHSLLSVFLPVWSLCHSFLLSAFKDIDFNFSLRAIIFFKLHDLNISNLSYLKTSAVIVLKCFLFTAAIKNTVI